MCCHRGGLPIPAPMNAYDGLRVFSATMVDQRAQLGDRVSAWLQDHPEIKVVDIVVMQSSDRAFHCLSICVFYRGKLRRNQ